MEAILAEAAAKESNPKEAMLVLLRADPSLKHTQNEDAFNRALVATLLALKPEDSLKDWLGSLDPAQLDTLMKGVYFGFKPVTNVPGKSEAQPVPAPACATLLKWHALILEKAGVGSIVRVISERVPLPPGVVAQEEEFYEDD